MSWGKEERNEWYKKNKSRVREKYKQYYDSNESVRKAASERTKKARRRNQEIVRKYKLERGCQRCGYRAHHVALDLHHIDKHVKEFKIGCTVVSVERLMKEVEKCEVLCSNCHKIHHYEEGWLKQ